MPGGNSAWSRRQRFAFATLSTVFGFCAALLTAEIALRLLSLAPAVGISTVTEDEFARLPGIFSPGQEIVDRRIAALPFAVRIDSLGYRGSDFPILKAPSELRMLSIGDSFTYGDFVDNDSTLPAVLQRQLATRCARPTIVINAGVGGSTISLQYQMLRRAWRMSPDVVLLTFSENDVTDLDSDMWQELASNRQAKSRFPLSIGYPLLRRLALWHFGLELRGRLRAARAPAVDTIASAHDESGGSEDRRSMYAAYLESLSAEVRARGKRLVLVIFPSHWTVRGTHSDDQLRWAEQMATYTGVASLNVLDTLRSSGLPVDSLYLLPHDGHPSPVGYELAGAWIADRLHEMNVCVEAG